MKILALLSFYDEDPAHLTRCVSSLAGFADHVIAVDGAYASFPGAQGTSPNGGASAIQPACERAGLQLTLAFPRAPWQGGEVEKRAAMFQYARDAGATAEDWLLIIDADMHVAGCEGARGALACATEDVAEVRWRDVRPDDHLMSDLTFRSLFRAIPGLTVKWTHYLYVQPLTVGWRYLWHLPSGHIAEDEPTADLTGCVTLHHRRLDRSAERDAAARTYYRERDEKQLEKAPHY